MSAVGLTLSLHVCRNWGHLWCLHDHRCPLPLLLLPRVPVSPFSSPRCSHFTPLSVPLPAAPKASMDSFLPRPQIRPILQPLPLPDEHKAPYGCSCSWCWPWSLLALVTQFPFLSCHCTSELSPSTSLESTAPQMCSFSSRPWASHSLM